MKLLLYVLVSILILSGCNIIKEPQNNLYYQDSAQLPNDSIGYAYIYSPVATYQYQIGDLLYEDILPSSNPIYIRLNESNLGETFFVSTNRPWCDYYGSHFLLIAGVYIDSTIWHIEFRDEDDCWAINYPSGVSLYIRR